MTKQMNQGSRTMIVVALAGILCATASAFASDWPAFRGNMQRTGYNHKAVTMLPAATWLWKVSLPGPVYSSPVVQDSLLFIGAADSNVYAVHIRTGERVWAFKTNDHVESTPLISADKLYAGSNDGSIYSLDLSSGRKIAQFTAGYQLSSCAYANNDIIVSGVGRPNSGIAFYKAPSAPQASQTSSPLAFVPLPMATYASPAISNPFAVIGSTDGGLHCINLSSYKIIWSIKTNGNFYLSSPAIADSVVYCAPGDFDPYVYAVDITDGRIIWKSAGDPVSVLSKRKAASSIDPKLVRRFLLSSPDYRALMLQRLSKLGVDITILSRLGAQGGALGKRTVAAGNTASFISDGLDVKTSSVAVDNNRVYVITKEPGFPVPRFSISALDRYSGLEAWKSKFSELRSCTPIGYCSSPVVSGNSVFFGWGEGKVYALSADSGKVQWQDSLSGDIVSSPAITDDRLYFATTEGYLYAFALTSLAPGLDFKTSTYCYPNPARGNSSTIQAYVAENAVLDMTVYNTAEKPVFRVSQSLSANKIFSYKWNISAVANGVYFAVVKVTYAGGRSEKKVLKVAVLK
jgi:eukaryotic-like serine/threonine-protein kinase